MTQKINVFHLFSPLGDLFFHYNDFPAALQEGNGLFWRKSLGEGESLARVLTRGARACYDEGKKKRTAQKKRQRRADMEKEVTVTVDRPLGSYHPKHKNLYYPVNYGYVEGVLGGDGEEQDAYILGVDTPLSTFRGRVIAVIRRADDVEEKWVVAPKGTAFTEEDVRRETHFQEQYFKISIEMLI
jgi:inorganic pyrophosphatase